MPPFKELRVYCFAHVCWSGGLLTMNPLTYRPHIVHGGNDQKMIPIYIKVMMSKVKVLVIFNTKASPVLLTVNWRALLPTDLKLGIEVVLRSKVTVTVNTKTCNNL